MQCLLLPAVTIGLMQQLLIFVLLLLLLLRLPCCCCDCSKGSTITLHSPPHDSHDRLAAAVEALRRVLPSLLPWRHRGWPLASLWALLLVRCSPRVARCTAAALLLVALNHPPGRRGRAARFRRGGAGVDLLLRRSRVRDVGARARRVARRRHPNLRRPARREACAGATRPAPRGTARHPDQKSPSLGRGVGIID